MLGTILKSLSTRIWSRQIRMLYFHPGPTNGLSLNWINFSLLCQISRSSNRTSEAKLNAHQRKNSKMDFQQMFDRGTAGHLNLGVTGKCKFSQSRCRVARAQQSFPRKILFCAKLFAGKLHDKHMYNVQTTCQEWEFWLFFQISLSFYFLFLNENAPTQLIHKDMPVIGAERR